MLFLVAFLQVVVSSVECYLACTNLHQAPFCQEAQVLLVCQKCVTEVFVPLSLGPSTALRPRAPSSLGGVFIPGVNL